MINYNGTITSEERLISLNNRGLAYGDALFETIKINYGKILFWEDHYFRLMASMRILRMEIPMNFTMEFLEEEIFKLLEARQLKNSTARVKLTIFRNDGGYYLPETNNISFIITANAL
jgi:branched-chain amino acid aminotransferase